MRASWIGGVAAVSVACAPESGIQAYNAEPTAAITSHADNSTFMEGVSETVRGTASDPDGNTTALKAVWYVDSEIVCEDATPDPTGVTTCDLAIELDNNTIMLEVRDADGASANHQISVGVTPTNAPEVLITQPITTGVYYEDVKVTFEALISDTEDSADELISLWESDIDGPLVVDTAPDAAGNIIGFSYLSEGDHAITIDVEDTTGKISRDTVSIRVGPPNTPPACTIEAPTNGTTGVQGELVLFEGTAVDPDVDNTQLLVSWSSDRDGAMGESPPDSSGQVTLPYSDLSVGTHVITLTVADELAASCSTSTLYTVGQAPEVAIVSPKPGSEFPPNTTIAFEATVSDTEDVASDLAIEWSSDLDGVVNTNPADSGGTAAFTTSALSLGTHTVTIQVTDSHDQTRTANVSLVVNGVPDAPTITISPDPAVTTEDLVANASGSVDPEGDTVTYTYEWFEAGVKSKVSTTPVFPAASTTKGLEYRVVATPWDATMPGTAGEAYLIVANAPPELGILAITPAKAITTSETLTCAATATDPDGDVPSITYEWTNDTTGAVLGNGVDITLDPASTNPADIIMCTVTATDDELATDVGQTAVEVGNETPQVTSIVISPSTGVTTTTDLYCTATATDADGDVPTIDYAWENATSGATLGTGSTVTLDAAISSPGDRILCVVTATDWVGAFDVDTAEVYVDNSDPVVDLVTITPDIGVTANTALTCAATVSDQDGGSPTLAYAWENTTTGTPLGTSSIVALSPATAPVGNTVECVVTATDSDGGTAVGSALVVVENTPPNITSASISPDPAYANDMLTCSWGYSDPDGHADVSTVEWTINGASAGNATTLSSGFVGGDLVECTVTPNDGFDPGTPVMASLNITHSDPEIDGVSLGPSPAYETDVLTCTPGAITDVDGSSSFTVTTSWQVNGGTLGVTSTSLDGSNFDKGDDITCTVTADDGAGISSPVVSNTITIDNTMPSITGVVLDPTPASASDALTCSWTGFADADGDPDITTVEWTVNGTFIATGTTLGSGFTGGDLVACEVTPYDGEDTGTPHTASTVIDSSAPTITSVTISPDPAYAGDVLTCLASGWFDPDGDPDLSTFEWHVDGALAGTGTTLSTAVVNRQVVTCTVTPYDGDDTGIPLSDSVTVGNTPPTLASVTLDPVPASEATVLVCSPGTATDADGETVTFNYTWAVNGSTIGATSSTLTGADFDKNDAVTCTAVPYDGTDVGTGMTSASVTIANSLPAIASLSIQPDPATASDPISCVWTDFSDADGDADATLVEWTINGIPAGTSATLSSGYVGDDLVECTATPYDGEQTGTPMSASLTVINDEPEVLSVNLSPNPVRTLDMLTASVSYNDADGDTVNLEYSWFVNGIEIGEYGSSLDGNLHFDKGDLVFVDVRPFDGLVYGATIPSSTLTVQNSQPQAPGIALTPPKVAMERVDDLICTIDALSIDDDLDPVSYTIEWHVDGTLYTGPVTTTAASGDTVLMDDLYPGTWQCRVTPNDGEDNGTVATASVEVEACLEPYLTFDGVDDYIRIGDTENLLGITNAFSVSAWVLKANGSGYTTIFDGEMSRSDIDEENAGFGVWMDHSGSVYAFYGTGNHHKTTSRAVAGWAVPEGRWTHVTATRDGPTIQIFINGSSVLTDYGAPADDINWYGAAWETDVYQIGQYEVVPEGGGSPSLEPMEHMEGQLSEIGIWNRMLDANEVYQLANFGLDVDLNVGLVGYWDMHEGSGGTVADTSGYGNDGTIDGPIWVDVCPAD